MAKKDKGTRAKVGKPKKKRGGFGKSAKQTKAQVERRQHMAMALELRLQFYTYRQIAHELSQPPTKDPATGEPTNYGIGRSVSLTTVYDWVAEAVAEIPVENAMAVKQMHLDRLDQLMQRVWRPIEVNTESVAREDLDQALRVMDRQARYIGLYTAEKEGGGSGLDRIADAVGGQERYIAMIKADAPVLRPDGPIPANPVL